MQMVEPRGRKNNMANNPAGSSKKQHAEIKGAERLFPGSKEEYRKFVDNFIEGIGISKGNKVIYANKALLDIFSYRSLAEFLKVPLLDHVTPESRALVRERIKKRARGAKLPPRYKYRIIRKDGTVRSLEISTSEVTIGNEKCVQSTFRDVTEQEQVNEALRESEERYKSIFEHIKDGVFTSTPAGKFTSVNPAMARMFGYKNPRQMFRLNIPRDLYPNPKDRKIMEKAIRRRGFLKDYELLLKKKDGTLFPAILTSTAVKDKKGRVLRYEGLLRDVTEQRRAENAVREVKEYLQRLVNTSPICIISTDLNKKIISFNKHAEEVYGYKSREIIGKHASILQPRGVSGALGSGEISRGILTAALKHDGWDGEFQNVRKNGEVFPIYLRTRKLLDDEGKTVGFMSIALDITEQKKLEKEVGETKSYLASITAGSADGIMSIDLNGKVVSWNKGASEILGYSRDEIVGRHYHALVPPKLLKEADAMKAVAVEQGFVRNYETYRLHKSGREIPVGMTLTAITDTDGKILGTSGIFKDLSERKKLERELKESYKELQTAYEGLKATDKLKNEFIANVSHELKTPVTAMMAAVDLILDENLDEDTRELFEIDKRNLHRLNQLITNILSFSVLEFGRKEVKYELIDIHKLVNEVVSEQNDFANWSKITIKTELQANLPVMRADRDDIWRILTSLLNNGIKFNKPNGMVKITASSIDDSVKFCIEDTGIGIAKENRDKIFERFYQIDGSTSRRYGGVGLDLAIVKRLVELYKGEIKVESELGKGSKFTVILPLEPQE